MYAERSHATMCAMERLYHGAGTAVPFARGGRGVILVLEPVAGGCVERQWCSDEDTHNDTLTMGGSSVQLLLPPKALCGILWSADRNTTPGPTQDDGQQTVSLLPLH